MKISTERDNCGNLMIYTDDHMISLPIIRRCPECKGRSLYLYYGEEPCWVCHGEKEMFVWRAWFWRLKLAFYDRRSMLSLWWYERTHKSEE